MFLTILFIQVMQMLNWLLGSQTLNDTRGCPKLSGKYLIVPVQTEVIQVECLIPMQVIKTLPNSQVTMSAFPPIMFAAGFSRLMVGLIQFH